MHGTPYQYSDHQQHPVGHNPSGSTSLPLPIPQVEDHGMPCIPCQPSYLQVVVGASPLLQSLQQVVADFLPQPSMPTTTQWPHSILLPLHHYHPILTSWTETPPALLSTIEGGPYHPEVQNPEEAQMCQILTFPIALPIVNLPFTTPLSTLSIPHKDPIPMGPITCICHSSPQPNNITFRVSVNLGLP